MIKSSCGGASGLTVMARRHTIIYFRDARPCGVPACFVAWVPEVTAGTIAIDGKIFSAGPLGFMRFMLGGSATMIELLF
jgi:hypothetical protein